MMGRLRAYLVVCACGWMLAASAFGQATEKAKAGAEETLATVNGEPITKSEVLYWLAKFEIEPGNEQRAYEAALNTIIDGKLIEQFMKRMRTPVAQSDIDRYVERFRASLRESNSSLESYLANTNTTPEQFNKMAASAAQWDNYVAGQARESALRQYLQDNIDVFSRAEVKASHILLETTPDMPAEQKEKLRQRLLEIKNEITSGKISFADAANKYSEDRGNKEQPSGGNLGFFPRKGVFIEAFSKAAFGLKEGEISDPIESEYGWHLIHVTGRKPGEPVAYSEEIKPFVLSVFAEELQEKLIENERKTAKIEIKPMPPDLFRSIPQAAPNPPAGGAGAAAASGTTKPGAGSR